MHRVPPAPRGPGQGPGGVRNHLVGLPWWIHVVELALIVAVVAVVVIAIILIVRAANRAPSTPRHASVSPALAELDLRYARGEIDHDDYAARRANLLGLGTPARAEPPPTEN